MPLRLLERVLPWLVSKLTDEDAQSFLRNLHMAGFTSRFLCVNFRSTKGLKKILYLYFQII